MKTKETKKMYYAAYGLLMNKNYILNDAGTKYVGKGEIVGHKLVARGHLTVIPQARKKVPVILYEISERTLKRLDEFECYPWLYIRDTVSVKTEQGTVKALVYKMKSERYGKGLQNLNEIVVEYCNHDFDLKYLTDALTEGVQWAAEQFNKM